MEKDNYLLRASRDTLMSQLGLAFAVPLPDVPLQAAEKVVVHDNNTWVEIGASQLDVHYQLCDGEGRTLSKADGNGGTLRLKTPKLNDEDYAFAVRATRDPGNGAPSDLASLLEVKLLQTVIVQVGIDTKLEVSPQELVVAFQSAAEVLVLSAQSKTRYQLVAENATLDGENVNLLGAAVLTSTSGDVPLRTRALTEDTTLVVRATNAKTKLSGFLTNRVDVMVGPNLALEATLASPVVDYNSTGMVQLAGTQQTASYQLQLKEMVGDAEPDTLPAVTGTGGIIDLMSSPLREDCTVRVRAKKVASGVADELAAHLAILVRPDPAKELLLVQDLTEVGKNTVVAGVAEATEAVIKVANTQRGVCYQLRVGTAPVGMPGYHHINAGIGQARIGNEFAVGTFTGDAVYLPTGVLTQTTEFSVHAFKPSHALEDVLIGTISVPVKAARL